MNYRFAWVVSLGLVLAAAARGYRGDYLLALLVGALIGRLILMVLIPLLDCLVDK